MERRRLNGLIALIVLVAVVGALTYFDVYTTRQPTETAAFAPAQSADDSGPAGETPIEPPAPGDVVANAPAPAAEAPASETSVVEAPAAEIAPVEAPAATDTQVAMADPKATEPTAPVPLMPGTPVVPTFDVVRVEPTGEAVIAGQAEPDAKVEVLDGAAPIATADANANGEWAIALDKPLLPGSHDLAVRTTSKDKAIATLSDQRVTVSVPEKGANDVLVVLNSPDAASKVLAAPGSAPAEDKTTGGQVASAQPATEPPVVTEPPVASEPKVALEAPVATEPPVKAEPPVEPEPQVVAKAAPAPEPPALTKPEVTVAAVEADTAGSLYIAGTATTGETVRIYVDGTAIGDATPSPSGTWLVETTRDMPAGKYSVRADQIDAAGAVIARSEVPFEREIDVAILSPTGTAEAGPDAGAKLAAPMPMETVIIKKGDNLWRIARGAWGKGVRWSTIYQANTEQIRNPHWIYPGQVFVMPKGNATWTD